MRAQVTLGASPAEARIEVEGVRIENAVRSLSIDAEAGHIPRINLTISIPSAISVSGEASVYMDEGIKDALIALGWAPPAEA